MPISEQKDRDLTMTNQNDNLAEFKKNMNTLFSVEGKVAVVTGGSRGIGEMIAAGFLAGGARVYISSRKTEVCDTTADRLSSDFESECISLPSDLSSVEGCQYLADAVAERESKLDILVNNAGVSWGESLDNFPEIGWDKVFDTNVKGIFFLTQKLLPLLRNSGTYDDPARIINIGSIDGIKNSIFPTFSYPPAKAAVHQLTRTLALHLTRENIIVNAIAPGPFPTSMLSKGLGSSDPSKVDWDTVNNHTPRKRMGTPEDIAGLTIFLCSRAGAFTVGEVITCDGGIAYAT